MIKQGVLERDGFRLSYSIEGKGIPAIIIGSSIYYPRTFSQNLRTKLQMIFMDHRGFGEALAPFTNASYQLNSLIDDIEALRQELNLDQVIIIGHSGHAFMALEYAKKYSEQVSQVILIASSPHGDSYAAADQYFAESVCPHRKSLYEKSMCSLKSDIEADPEKRFITYSLRSGPRIWYNYQYDAASLWEDVKLIPEIFDYLWGEQFKTIDISKNLERLDKPVLLILGRYDYWNPPHLWEPLRCKFNNLTIRVFEQSGHTPQLEEPEYFDEEVLSWLSSHS